MLLICIKNRGSYMDYFLLCIKPYSVTLSSAGHGETPFLFDTICLMPTFKSNACMSANDK